MVVIPIFMEQDQFSYYYVIERHRIWVLINESVAGAIFTLEKYQKISVKIIYILKYTEEKIC